MILDGCVTKNWTAAKLKSLRPGESFRFYVGDLDSDAQRAANDDEVALYAAVLGEIVMVAEQLRRAGKIRVDRLKRDRELHTFEYVATGQRVS